MPPCASPSSFPSSSPSHAAPRPPPVECGDEVASEDDVGRYCSYIVVRGGFTCPAALEHALPVGTGMVCTDVRDATPESILSDACAGLSDPRCGIDALSCAEPTLATSVVNCAPAFPEPVDPRASGSATLLDVATDAVLDDGDSLTVGTATGRLARRQRRDAHRDGWLRLPPRRRQRDRLGRKRSLDPDRPCSPRGTPPAVVFTFGVPGVGPATVRLSFRDLTGQVLVWEREPRASPANDRTCGFRPEAGIASR
ncbi:MAG: hypothetical protein H6721_06705 [Sandaracinus sp.]|nr:hypothetical protein [Sandaracinus sp.]